MPKSIYQISLKGYLGGYDFNRATLDKKPVRNYGETMTKNNVELLVDTYTEEV